VPRRDINPGGRTLTWVTDVSVPDKRKGGIYEVKGKE